MKLLFSLLLVAVSLGKRVSETDTPRSPSILGGGDVNHPKRSRIKSDAASSSLLLLQSPSEPIRESYSFLLDDRYSQCYDNDNEGQGLSCNSCWAFAVQKMMQSRLCRINVNARSDMLAGVFYSLSPLNMICHLQSSEDGVSICDPKNIFDALEYATEPGILLGSWVSNWK